MERKTVKRNANPKPGYALGRIPNIYHEGHNDLVFNLRLLGASDNRIAASLRISEITLHEWLDMYPDLLAMYNKGNVQSDAFVAKSMYHRATGYNHEKEKLWYDNKRGQVIRATYTEHYPPDVNAGFKWLANRQPDLWRDNSTDPLLPNGLPPVIVLEPVWNSQRASQTIDSELAEPERVYKTG